MKFHLNYTPRPSPVKIGHRHKLLLTGSCFSEHIGQKLRDHKFDPLVNPGGILFNPSSIFNFLDDCIAPSQEKEKFILEREGKFFSFQYHSSVCAYDRPMLLQNIEQLRLQTAAFIRTANFLAITFGTAFVYHHNVLDAPVANCHKQHETLFTKKLLEVEAIVSMYSDLIQKLRTVNPDLQIIFTVSPVKHLRDGVEQNSISKATLLLSIKKIIEKEAHCFYFPAFELLNDDLRDHRFYKEDLAHPNDLAINYIWEKFTGTFFSPVTRSLLPLLQKLHQAENHRPLTPGAKTDQSLSQHIEGLQKEILKLDPAFIF